MVLYSFAETDRDVHGIGACPILGLLDSVSYDDEGKALLKLHPPL
jgi:hypothetical protein